MNCECLHSAQMCVQHTNIYKLYNAQYTFRMHRGLAAAEQSPLLTVVRQRAFQPETFSLYILSISVAAEQPHRRLQNFSPRCECARISASFIALYARAYAYVQYNIDIFLPNTKCVNFLTERFYGRPVCWIGIAGYGWLISIFSLPSHSGQTCSVKTGWIYGPFMCVRKRSSRPHRKVSVAFGMGVYVFIYTEHMDVCRQCCFPSQMSTGRTLEWTIKRSINIDMACTVFFLATINSYGLPIRHQSKVLCNEDTGFRIHKSIRFLSLNDISRMHATL